MSVMMEVEERSSMVRNGELLIQGVMLGSKDLDRVGGEENK